ncbi:hypothetical protein [Rhodococcoides yunnanense]|nr:hypothetical protein [Rhodococcus yunnanensis]
MTIGAGVGTAVVVVAAGDVVVEDGAERVDVSTWGRDGTVT